MLRHAPIALLFLAPMPASGATTAPVAEPGRQCSIDSLPEPQRRRLIDGYVLRHKTEGKARADAWALAQEDTIYRQLVEQGACSATNAPRRAAPAARPAGKTILNRQGKPCRHIEVENQVFPGFGGEPMRMALVQVCKD